MRRCGKSYLLFRLFYQHLIAAGIADDHIVKIALDDIESKPLHNALELYRNIKTRIKDEDVYYVLLDEVQLVEGFEEVLNSLLRIDNVDVYVTGSNSRFLSTDIITEFRGRGDEIRMFPLSLSEYCEGAGKSPHDAWKDYYTYGGLPHILTLTTDKKKIDYLTNLFDSVYLVDVLERHRIKNESEMEELVRIVASGIGAPTNPTKLSNTFKSVKRVNVSPATIDRYLSFLQDAFMIEKSERYDIKGKKYISSLSKYYFTDIGLRNALLGMRQLEETHIMENIVYNELLIRGYNVDVGVVEIFDKDKEGKRVRKQLEVDFVVNQGNQRYYIQVAYDMTSEEKQTQEFNSLRNIPDSFKKIVIVNGSKKPWRNDEGFVIMGMKYFLLNANSLEF